MELSPLRILAVTRVHCCAINVSISFVLHKIVFKNYYRIAHTYLQRVDRSENIEIDSRVPFFSGREIALLQSTLSTIVDKKRKKERKGKEKKELETRRRIDRKIIKETIL